jgi:hypothetical protein
LITEADNVPDASPATDEFVEVVAALSDAHGVSVRDARPALEGESGGAWFARCEGAEVVVKWVEAAAAARFDSLEEAFTIARARGVPIPERWPPLVVGERCVLLQRAVSGATGAPTPALIDDVATAISRLGSIHAPDHLTGTWGDTVVRSLQEGLDEWCEHGALLRAGGELAEVVRVARRLGASVDAEMFPTTDLMHLDLHTKNVLLDDHGHLAAIVDWEGACGGDLRFDLTYFAFAAGAADPGISRPIWTTLEVLLPPELLAAYTVHAVLRMVDWSFRHHDQATVETWLRPGAALLRKYT